MVSILTKPLVKFDTARVFRFELYYRETPDSDHKLSINTNI